jgi:hypothetical protein
MNAQPANELTPITKTEDAIRRSRWQGRKGPDNKGRAGGSHFFGNTIDVT